MDPLARLCFGLIWDRFKLSRHNTLNTGSGNWVTSTGKIYCVYPQEELARDMGCSIRTVRRCMQDLVREKVIVCFRDGFGSAARIAVYLQVHKYLTHYLTDSD